MRDTIFRDPVIPDGEKSVYAVSIADQAPAFDLVSVIGHDGPDYRSIVHAGAVTGEFTITVEQRFQRAGDRLRVAGYRAETRSGTRVVSREEADFLGTEHVQIGVGVGPFPVDLMPLAGGLTLLRGLDFTEGAETEIALWLAFSVHIPVSAKIEQRTVIEVPAGRFDCWQVRLRPRLSGLNPMLEKLLSGFLPPAVVHVEAAAPHRMVRLGFPTGPMPWNPRGLMELVT
ncbi:hypothetical protein [Nocardia goodfellowii]|uniref:Uncharacterized protein n=1 Tax=Nocardia goodfellowii TaxID=882446 RepID=A0ABS4QKG4_9NOCA|nr:hypothetical protein [Nocardia goodfellowii]MBP2192199.1 hypothetical protein [Nocardia goodfellowii]